MEALTNLLGPQDPALDVYWRAFELRPKGSPPMPPEYRQRIEAMQPQLYAIARERYGRELKQGPFGVDSRPALIGAKYAESKDVGPAYHAAVMRAYWQEGRDIGKASVLGDIAQAAGLPRDEYLAALDDPDFDAQVQADIDTAHAYGINGVPALIFNDRYMVSGAQPADVLRRVVAQIAAE